MVAVVLVGAGVVALGLSGGDDGGTSTAPADLDIGDVEPALLDVSDVGEGFTVDRDDSDDSETSLDDADVAPDCREALDRLEADDDGGGDEVEARFEREEDGVGVQHALAIIDSDEPTIDDVGDALRRCERISYEEEGRQVELRFGIDDVDDLGDDAIALEMSFDIEVAPGSSVTIDSYGLVVAQGGVASTVMVTGPLDPFTLESGSADRDLARDLAERADEKLRDVLEN